MVAPGTRFGPYEIVGSLGSGGMGDVYRAHDTTLGRQVAIKILPSAFADDADRRVRFEREARTLALLNHPHIAAVYGLESANGQRGIILELVEGETLRDRIQRGLSVKESLALARQIAEALEAAHDRGIVHRDLKPANVKVTPDGAAKVLDFGIAKAIGRDTDAPSDDSPTVTADGTRAGDVLGTPAYMSPEQARGQIVDRRTDLWAFGCVLYEMLTGGSAFGRETPSDTTAAILERDPDWRALPVDTPPSIRTLLKRCLEKDKRQRLDSAAAARLEIADALAGDRRDGSPATAAPRWRLLALTAGASAVVAAVIMWGLLGGRAVDSGAPLQFTIVPPSNQIIAVPGFRRSIAISPDSRYVAYFSGPGGNIGPLVLRRLDQLEGRLVAGAAFTGEVTFSPDSKWMAVVDGLNTISKVPVDGGPPVEIVRNNIATGSLSWGDDDSIAFATLDPLTGLLRIPANGGDVEVLTRPDHAQEEVDHTAPFIIPRGRGVLFAITRTSGADVAVLDLKTRRYKRLIRGGMPHYVELADATGRRREFVVFAVDNSVRAVPFDVDRLELAGDPVILADQVFTTANGRANFSISQAGTLVYMPATATPARSLVWVDRKGSIAPIQGMPALAYETPRLSRDDSAAAFIVGGTDRRLATWNFKARSFTRIGGGSGAEADPAWMPDGRDLLFGSTQNGTVLNIYRQAADGSGAPKRVFPSSNQQHVRDVVPDGTQALVFEEGTKGGSLLLIPTVAGGGNPRTIFANTADPRLSPDARFIAYISVESGTREVFVRPFPDMASARWQVSRGGGNSVAWSRDGAELFYIDESDNMMAARTTRSGAAINVETPRKLFDSSFARIGGEWIEFDVAADGRFLMSKPDTGPAGITSSTLIVKTRALDASK